MNKKILFLLIFLAGMAEYGCKKNNSSGPPTITAVRAVDSTKRDSLFTKALPGTLVDIVGKNLDGLQAVFFNDTSANFNPAYATGSNIIVYIPATAQTAATNPQVPSQIRIVTDHGTASFSFSLYLPPPAISAIAFDNSGTKVVITGSDFKGVTKVVFPGGLESPAFTVNGATQITATIPQGNTPMDSLRVTCTFGTAAFSYPPPMTVTGVSNENAPAGSTIIITGTNFVGISQVLFPGNIPGTNITPISITQFSVTVPPGITTGDSLSVTGALGTAVLPLVYDSWFSHPSPGYQSNFENQWANDNTGFIGWTGTYVNAATTTANYPGGTGASAALIQGSDMNKNSGVGSQGNAGFIQLNDGLPWSASGSESIKNYALKFEVYVKKPWSAGAIWISVGKWYAWQNYAARYAPWTSAPSGTFQPAGWVTATIPLTQFLAGNPFWKTSYNASGLPASVFSDYPVKALCFMLVNDLGTAVVPANTLEIAIDNVRIVKVQ